MKLSTLVVENTVEPPVISPLNIVQLLFKETKMYEKT